MAENNNGGGGFLTGLVLGAILGTGFIYFLSLPEERKVIKKRLKEKTGDALDNLRELIREIEEKEEEFKKKAIKVQGQLNDKTKERNFSSIEKLREKGRRAIRSFMRSGKPLV